MPRRDFASTAKQPSSLIAALAPGREGELESAQRSADELYSAIIFFPNVLPAIAAALGGSRSLVVG